MIFRFKARLAGTTALVLSAGLAWVSEAHAAPAQTEDAPAAVEQVVVTARRAVATPPRQIKREAPGIVDAITAQEIEKTPDATLAEVLDRVVGVSSDKFYGTADSGYASIRGFDSRYNSMDIDGNPIWFSSQNNRGAQLGMFPAGIVKETSVYKTVTPDQDGNSVGGHISLRTLRAFDGGARPYLSLGARVGGYDQDGVVTSGPSGRIYGAGKTTFGADHQFGLVVGLNAQRTINSDVYGGSDTYLQVDGQDLPNANVYSNSVYDKAVDNIAGYAKLEVRATDKLYGFLSVNLFDESRRQFLERTATYIYATSGRTTDITDGAANFNKAVGQTKEYDYDIGRKAKVLGSGLDYRIGERSVVTLRGNYTDFENHIVTRYPETFQLTNLSGHYDLNGDVPVVTFTNANYGDPANWVYRNTSASYVRDQMLRDKVYALRADYDFNTFASARGLGVKVGASWNRLDRRYDQQQANYLLPKTPALTLASFAPAGAVMTDHGAVKMNWDSFWAYVYANGTATIDAGSTADYALVEDVAALHGTLYLTGERYRLLAGLRYEATRFTDETSDVIKGVVTPASRKRDYANWLPNLQATYDLSDKLKLRGGVTRTIARADFADFAPGRTATLDTNGNPVIKGANPNLLPREATNYDASLEYYFEGGYASLAVFQKDLDHETFSQQTLTRDASGVIILTEETPLNTGAAKVRGLEVAVTKPRLESLPAPFDGLGFSANYTLLDGEWNVVFTDGSRRSVSGLRNQPKWVGNLNLTYAAGPVDLNLAWRLRGRTFTGTFGTTAAGDIWIEGAKTLDLQANYKLAKGLQVSLEARNLTDAYTTQTTGLNRAIYNSVGSGRSYFLGVKYKY